MKVSIKDFNITMELGNKAIELEVYDYQGKHLGDLVIGRAKLEWCKGRTHVGNGIKKKWSDLISWFES